MSEALESPDPDALEPLVRERRLGEAQGLLKEIHDADAAEALARLGPAECAAAFRLLARDRAPDVFALLPSAVQEALVDHLDDRQAARIFEEMDPDDRVDFFEDAPAEMARTLLPLMRAEARALTERLLAYPPESVGRLVTPRYLTVRPAWRAREALEHVRTRGTGAETLDVLYVIENRSALRGQLRLAALVLADPETPCADLAEPHVVSVEASEDREEAVRLMRRYDVPVLPVVEAGERLIGIVTFDDVADVAEEEFTEDVQKLGAVQTLAAPYRTISVLPMVAKRVPWLAGLFVAGLLTVSAMSGFEEAIAEMPILALFVPLIIATGGNSGAQAATVLTRALALQEITARDGALVLFREVFTGLALGAALGLLGTVVAGGTALVLGAGDALQIGGAIGVAVAAVAVVGNLVGSLLPLALERIGLDPATCSTPVVATIVDVLGLLIYFGIATLLL